MIFTKVHLSQKKKKENKRNDEKLLILHSRRKYHIYTCSKRNYRFLSMGRSSLAFLIPPRITARDISRFKESDSVCSRDTTLQLRLASAKSDCYQYFSMECSNIAVKCDLKVSTVCLRFHYLGSFMQFV